MKTASAGLKSLLANNRALYKVELLTITLAQGAGVYYYCSGGKDIVYGGHTYKAADGNLIPAFQRGPVTTAIGTDTKNMELTLLCGPSTVIGSLLVPTFADYGGFDQAIVELDGLPMNTWGDTSNGTYNIWTGIVGDVRGDDTEVQLEVASVMRLLQGAFPRNYTLPTCNNTLFDAACTLVKSSYATAGSVAAGTILTNQFTTGGAINSSAHPFPQGSLTWLTGPNAGLSRTIKSYTGFVLVMNPPLPYLPTVGDTFTAYPGCDKTQNTCITKYGNVPHFRGFPYMPNPITLLAGAGSEGVAGGGSSAGGNGSFGLIDFGPGGTNGSFKQV